MPQGHKKQFLRITTLHYILFIHRHAYFETISNVNAVLPCCTTIFHIVIYIKTIAKNYENRTIPSNIINPRLYIYTTSQAAEIRVSLYKIKILHNKPLRFNGVYCIAASMPKHEIEISLFSTFPLSFLAGRGCCCCLS